MIRKRLESTRELLEDMISSGNYDYEEILSKSQELDRLIVLSLKENQFLKEIMMDSDFSQYDFSFDTILEFDKLYDSMRIVDPIRKAVLDFKQVDTPLSDFQCYEFWNKNTSCENCISIRAYNENEIFFKFEYNLNSTYMVTSIPIIMEGKKLAVELLKNISSVFQPPFEGDNRVHIISSIEHMNQFCVKDELTSLYNQRFIRERLPVDLIKSSMADSPLSTLLVDLDLEQISKENLKDFANAIQNLIPEDEHWIARRDNSSFVICLNDTDDTRVESIIENIKKIPMPTIVAIGDVAIGDGGDLLCSSDYIISDPR